MANRISTKKAKRLIFLLRSTELMRIKPAAKSLGLSRNTVRRYLRTYLSAKSVCEDRLPTDEEIFPPFSKTSVHSKNKMHLKKECKWKSNLLNESDLEQILQWKKSKDKRKWDWAITLLSAQEGMQIKDIAKKVERHPDTVKEWIMNYSKKGLSVFQKHRKANEAIQLNIISKKENLIKLIHETPQLHGINRTSWGVQSLSDAYRNHYGSSLSKSSLSEYLKKEGYSFKKAREVLTSPDPLFREKLDKIKSILSNLKPNEKFFSVDEFGPFAVKMKGGRSLTKGNEVKSYPQIQRSKGCLICTAALELSTNQITHFYSLKKNTKEMIRLLEVLIQEYVNEERIYFSWDAASWHASKELYSKIEEINSDDYKKINKSPFVELAPLPASAQFLNVIESVFSGLAKSVIHNSNYQSVEEAKKAIDTYFSERNLNFKKNPKRAGKMIWGNERVAPSFSETNNCKDPAWR